MKLFLKHSPVYTLFTLFILTQTGHAAPPGMSDQQMQQMMQKAQAAQQCFSKIDRSNFDKLEAKGKKMEADIKALCAAGKRDKAMSTAMEYSKQMENDPAVKEMRKCSEMMEGAMAGMSQSFMPPTEEERKEAGHVCDNM